MIIEIASGGVGFRGQERVYEPASENCKEGRCQFQKRGGVNATCF